METNNNLNPFSKITADKLKCVGEQYQTPLYVYDEALIKQRCKELNNLSAPYGKVIRYALKANTLAGILRIIDQAGLSFEASSLLEVLRAQHAGIAINKILLTSQETYDREGWQVLKPLLKQGLQLNLCSLKQLDDYSQNIQEPYPLSLRLHPGQGSGESASRNTGDAYACFGIHQRDLPAALQKIETAKLTVARIHMHIGSGGNPKLWLKHVDTQLKLIQEHFPAATILNLGGGLKEARMPEEKAADVHELFQEALKKVEAFYQKTGRQLILEIEPGSWIMANSGYGLTKIMDIKSTGAYDFLVCDGGMDLNLRPLLYGARHPLYLVRANGERLFSPFWDAGDRDYVVNGCCCESGDSQTLNALGEIEPRRLKQPEVGDYCIIGGLGAYGSSMAASNYNSHLAPAEVLVKENGETVLLKRRQNLNHLCQNEILYDEFL